MGEYIRDEITAKGKILEDADIYLGVPEEKMS